MPDAYAAVGPPDSQQRDEIVHRFLPRVKFYAHKYAFGLPPELDVEDLVSAGIVGLLEAVNRFDPSMNTTLSTFADFRIRGAIIDEVRSMQWASKDVKKKIEEVRRTYDVIEREKQRSASDEEVAERLNISLDELHKILSQVNTVRMVRLEDLGINRDGDSIDILECISAEGSKDMLEELGLKELQSALGKSIDALPEKERLVMTLYYYEELNMKEIGKVLNVSESRVCQLHGKALMRLRTKMGDFKR
ncbi:MAG TPA: FliA/WhiG family RNA polymerase sigma factor [Dissulfurispiraceae bacterium]|nr:FliA/WhiG family RNA polymerase sigma factor [Dissulfurispiraceae bacterium]